MRVKKSRHAQQYIVYRIVDMSSAKIVFNYMTKKHDTGGSHD